MTQTIFFVLFITPGHGPHRKHSSSIVAHTCLRGNTPTQLFHSNGHTHYISYHGNYLIVVCGHYLATAISLAPQFLLWANTIMMHSKFEIPTVLLLNLLINTVLHFCCRHNNGEKIIITFRQHIKHHVMRWYEYFQNIYIDLVWCNEVNKCEWI
jgi:hypothetical protein